MPCYLQKAWLHVAVNLVGRCGFVLGSINSLIKIKSSLYPQYYAEARNEWRRLSPRFSAWPTQLRRNATAVACPGDAVVDLIGPGIEPQTSRAVSDVITIVPIYR